MTDSMFADLFRNLADEEIAARIQGGLTTQALEAARLELASRGIEPPEVLEHMDPETMDYMGDMVVLARDLDPTEAHILASCLAAAGIAADTGDVNIVHNNALWSIALGGAKVRVPQPQLAQARQVLESFRRGEFALGDDFDVGSAVE